MDKKKVKEHIQRALVWIDPMTTESANYETAIEMAAKNLEFALEELSKSGWVSVEDGLPEYDETVDVRIMILDEEIRYGSSARWKNKKPYLDYDSNGFAVFCRSMIITHWKPIEKLEE